MQKQFNPNKIWSSKSAVHNKRVIHNTQPSFFYFFLVPQALLSKLFSLKKLTSYFNNETSKTSRPKIRSNKNTEYKIFKPAAKEIVKENIKNAIPLIGLRNKSKKTFSLGFKDLKQLRQEFQVFSFKSIWYNINFYVTKWRIFERFNQILISALAIVSLIFISYLSLFDTYFLIKNYTVSFDDSSYLSKKDTAALLKKIKDNKFLGVLPSNQLWFLNSNNLTYISSAINPEISSFEVQKRVWPNTAQIKIKTEPILLTLGINGNEYWRISKTGAVVTQDDAGIRENLIVVDKPVYFNKSGITFQDISFVNNSQQFNRFWYINWLKKVLIKNNLEFVKINIPSLFDTDVTVTTSNGTELKFNSESISKDVQEEKIISYLKDPSFIDGQKSNKFKYIDFRISKRIFICERGLECDK
ncbi:MAG: hypothetical protein H7196_01735 [candidate division SR1 bacterium]|nr:hypothetical protein [candidate division SR1 bacterium]